MEEERIPIRASIIVYMEDTIEDIQTAIGDIGTLLDTINGEVV